MQSHGDPPSAIVDDVTGGGGSPELERLLAEEGGQGVDDAEMPEEMRKALEEKCTVQ